MSPVWLVSSTRTTASAPSGMGAPVMILMAVPAADSLGGDPTGRNIFEDGQVDRGRVDVLGPNGEAVHGRVRERRNRMRGNRPEMAGTRPERVADGNEGGGSSAQGAQDLGLGDGQRAHQKISG